MRPELLKGNLDMLLLSVLKERPAHGYAIIEELRSRSNDAFDLAEGTVYPALHRLEREGLLLSHWSEGDGRRRRVYQLSGRGSEALADRQGEWNAFAKSVRLVVEGA